MKKRYLERVPTLHQGSDANVRMNRDVKNQIDQKADFTDGFQISLAISYSNNALDTKPKENLQQVPSQTRAPRRTHEH